MTLQGSCQTSYIHYKTGLFGSYYEEVAHENLIYVANSLGFGSSDRPASHASERVSWGKGIAACVLGGLLISAGRSWESNQNTLSDALATIKGTLGSTAFKVAFVFQMAAIVAVSRSGGGVLPGALLAGMMLLPESVKGQTLCPQLVGRYNISGYAYRVTVFGDYAYVADRYSGLQIIDVSNVANPTLADSYDTPNRAWDAVVSGNYAYVADGGSGLQIIDVSNVANPTLAGSYATTPSSAYAVVVSGNYAYVAAGYSGLQIISIPCSTNNSLTTSSSFTTSSTRTSSSTMTFSSSSTSFSSTTTFSSSTISSSHLSSSKPTSNPSRSLSSKLSTLSSSSLDRSTTATIMGTRSQETISSENDGPNFFLIVGIPVGIVGVAGLITLLAYLYLQRRQKENRKELELDALETNAPDEDKDAIYANIPSGINTEAAVEAYANIPSVPKTKAEEEAYANFPRGTEYANIPSGTKT